MAVLSAGHAGPRPSPRCSIRRGGGSGHVVVASAAARDPELSAGSSVDGGRDAMGARRAQPQQPRPQWPQRPRQQESTADSSRGWQWKGRPRELSARPVQHVGSTTEREQQQQHQQQKQGLWALQPHQPAPRASDGPPQSRQPHGGYTSSGQSSEGDDDDEGPRQQRRQWRQHTLRSLRQDLHQQQRQQGHAAGASIGRQQVVGSPLPTASYSNDLEADGEDEFGWQKRSAGSGAGRMAAGGAPLFTQPRAGGGGYRQYGRYSSSGEHQWRDEGMLPEGYFLNSLRAQGVVGPDGQPTEQGRGEGVGLSSYLNVGINKMLAQSTDLSTIFCIVRDVGYLMDSINTSTAMHRLGRLARRRREMEPGVNKRVVSHPSYQLLVARVGELVPQYQPRGLANTMWGLAALGDVDRAKLACELAQVIVSHPAGDYLSQELANVVWAMGTLGVLCEEVLDRLLEGAVQQIDSFIPQGLSNMVWAIAHLRNGTRGCIRPRSGGNPPTHVPRKLRPTWQPAPAFLEAVAVAATRQMPEFQSQTLSNLLWGFCKLDVYPQQLFEAAAMEIVDRFRTPDLARQFRAQELSNSLYAFAQGNIINEQLLGAFERELSTSWVELDSAGRERRVSRLDDFTSQALANTLWSFAYLRWYPVQLLDPITRAVGRKMHTMSSQEISNSIWSFAKFAYHPGPVMAQYQVEVVRRVEQFDRQSLTTTLWAMAALSATHCEAFVKLLERFVVLERTGCFQDVQYNQVLQAVLLAQFEMQRQPGEFRADIDLPDDIVDRALQAWQAQQQTTKLSSFQLEVSDALGQLGIEHELEYLTAVNLLSVDVAIVKEGKKLAVEVDGPFHFSVNTNSPLGQTMIRRRLLRAVGWTVISVPYHAWYKLPLDQRPVYLSRLLVRKDGSFHDQIMKVSEDLLSTEFKKGLGSEAGVDAYKDDEEVISRQRRAPRNLGRLLEREGLMLTRSAARRLVDMGYAEHLSVNEGEGQEPTFVYQALRSTPDGATTGLARRELMLTEAANSDDEGTTMTIDAIIEAVTAGSADKPTTAASQTAATTTQANNGGAVSASKEAQAYAMGPASQLPARHLQVDEVDRENPLRPRYTDFSGNVLEGVEPFNLHAMPLQYTRRFLPRPSQRPVSLPGTTSRSRPSDGGGMWSPTRRNPMARQQQQPSGGWRQQREERPVPPSNQLVPPSPSAPPLPSQRRSQLPTRLVATPPTSVPRSLRAPPSQQLQRHQGPLPWQVSSSISNAALPAFEAAPMVEGNGPAKSVVRQQAPRRKEPTTGPQTTGMGSNYVLQLASKLSLVDLRRLAESKGLPSYGTKAQVAARLVAHDIQQQQQ